MINAPETYLALTFIYPVKKESSSEKVWSVLLHKAFNLPSPPSSLAFFNANKTCFYYHLIHNFLQLNLHRLTIS